MRRADEYVYVNQDGTVRELSEDERRYLSQGFSPSDGARPYIKLFYRSRDGWGSRSGFLPRKRVPSRITIEPVNPQFAASISDARNEIIEDSKQAGDIVTENPDGSIRCSPNPNISKRKRFQILRSLHLARQVEQERLAKHPDYRDREKT
jgi:hypothetical protein